MDYIHLDGNYEFKLTVEDRDTGEELGSASAYLIETLLTEVYQIEGRLKNRELEASNEG